MHTGKLFQNCGVSASRIPCQEISTAGSRDVQSHSRFWPPPELHLVTWWHRWQQRHIVCTAQHASAQLTEKQGPWPHSIYLPLDLQTDADLVNTCFPAQALGGILAWHPGHESGGRKYGPVTFVGLGVRRVLWGGLLAARNQQVASSLLLGSK